MLSCRLVGSYFVLGTLAVMLTCSPGHAATNEPMPQVSPAPVAQPAPPASTNPHEYTLGPGDKVRVTTFGEQDLSGEFEVGGAGKISMPLVGDIAVTGRTVTQVISSIEEKLRGGYLRDPKVNIDVLNYRPFFILGEVIKPGSYPYVSGMTVVNAVALAGGYTYRADKDGVTIEHAGNPNKKEQKADETGPVLPGDIVRVPERFF
ncbi:MAG: polysaccharide biosynthesis/export family protein [Alphaproteobacteria bacterium]